MKAISLEYCSPGHGYDIFEKMESCISIPRNSLEKKLFQD